jgi:hypothetical protein
LFGTDTLAGLHVDCENAISFNCRGDHTEGQQDTNIYWNKAERSLVSAVMFIIDLSVFPTYSGENAGLNETGT